MTQYGTTFVGAKVRRALLLAVYCLAAVPMTHEAQARSDVDAGAMLKGLDNVELQRFGTLDLDRLAAEDSVNDALPGMPRRYAVPRKVKFHPASSGTWIHSDQGFSIWRLRVRGDGAAHLNFGFDRFVLPEGASLTIAATQGKAKLGPFTHNDMLPHGQLWTPVLMGEEAVLYLQIPAGRENDVDLVLSRINQGYRGFGVRSKACKSGSCNTDVACLSPEDPWNENRRAVGALSNGGSAFCTGSLINNTANDRRMLFATATHCGVNSDSAVASVVVYWNYESPTCRVPGSAESGAPPAGPPTSTSPGLRFLAGTNSPFDGSGAAGTRSDWSLMELAVPPADNDFDLFWAGWDRRPPPTTCAAPGDPAGTDGLCASIHHPGGDEKRITFVESDMTLDGIASAANVHWLANWDPSPPQLPLISPLPPDLPPSVTEPGSSGSPLYNAERRLVGVLSGGASFCGVSPAGLNDQYGGLFHAWDGLGTPATRMRDHLDPLGSNADFIDGISACAAPPVPTGVTAQVSGENEITVRWNAVGGADRYRVFRGIGTCPGSGFVKVGEVNGTRFVDDSVSGGTSYVYRVSAFSDAERCPSRQSACEAAVATGACTRAPTFTGLASAVSAEAALCGVALEWPEAESHCTDGDLRYNVYRSGDPLFEPSPGNLIASCRDQRRYLDEDVGFDTTFHYLVRAEDQAAGPAAGQCGGLEDDNLSRQRAAAAGPRRNLFRDDVESGPDRWLVDGSGTGGENFVIVNDLSASPVSSWFVVDPLFDTDRRLTLAEPLVPPAGSRPALRFSHRFELEAGFDGGVLEFSVDGGASWQDMLAGAGSIPANADRFLANGYAGTLSSQFGNPLGGRPAWTGSSGSAFIDTLVDLSDFAGETILLRFRFGSDESIGGAGWWIDDIVVTRVSSCQPASAVRLFRDNFEAQR